MPNANSHPCDREYDFALIVDGVSDLTDEVVNALFGAGCGDATPSILYGRLYMEFSRSGPSLKDTILSAIRDVHRAGIRARVLRVDECNLVSAAEIGRRINRSRQQVHQYMTGQRGPGGFPPPVCYLSDRSPLWAWCAVSYWLVQNNLLRPEECLNAEVVEAINDVLDDARKNRQHPGLLDEIAREMQGI